MIAILRKGDLPQLDGGSFEIRSPLREYTLSYTLGIDDHDEAAEWLREHEPDDGDPD